MKRCYPLILASVVSCSGEGGFSSGGEDSGTASTSSRPGDDSTSTTMVPGTTMDPHATTMATLGMSSAVSSASVGGSTGLVGMAGPGGHWVLRDSADEPIEALIFASCSPGALCGPQFAEQAYDCVNISYYGQDYVNVLYQLATGSVGPCYAQTSSWDDLGFGYYLNSQCTGEQVATSTGARVFVAGTLYFSDAMLDAGDVPSTYYLRSGAQCLEVDNSTAQLRFYPYREVPPSVLNLLDNPPYSVSIEYQ